MVNDVANPVDWTKLKSVPAGFADGTDAIGPGDGHSLDASDGDPVDALYVDLDGDVGIGTTSPTRSLHIKKNTNNLVGIKIENTDPGNFSGMGMIFVDENGEITGIQVYDDGFPSYSQGMHIYNNRIGGYLSLLSDNGGIRISDNGNVGINATNPQQALTVYKTGSTPSYVQLANGATDVGESDGFQVGISTDGTAFVFNRENRDINFGTNGSTRAVLTADGKLGLGAAVPAEKLHVAGDIRLDPGNEVGFGGSATRLVESGGSLFVNSDYSIYLRPDKHIYIGADVGSDWAVFDNSNDRMGVGITAPSSRLHVEVDDYGLSIRSRNTNALGAGVLGVGGGLTGYAWGTTAGVSGSGYDYGLFGKAYRTGNNGQAGLYASLSTGEVSRVCYRSTGGTHYKIQGNGIESTIMSTSAGNVSLVGSESPEAWFEDFGAGEITDGRCRVDLDPLFLECITVSKDHPLKVFVQLTAPLVNQFYVDKGETGFDVVVVEDGAENASATFDYKVMGKWRGYENLRFEQVTGLDGFVQESSAESGQD